MVSPIALFAALLAAWILTIVVDRAVRRRRAREIFALARTVRMNYSPLDRFELATRLRKLPAWSTDLTELRVRDVLYAAHDKERRFVATAIRRHTRDGEAAAFVITCVEQLDDGAFREVAERVESPRASVVDVYRRALLVFEPAT